MRIINNFVILGLMVTCASPVPAQISTRNKPREVPNEVVIKYKTGEAATTAASTLVGAGVTVIETLPVLPIVVGKVASGKKVDEVLTACRALSQVEYAEPNFRVYALESAPADPVTPNDLRFELLWGLHQQNDHDIDAPEAWAITTGSSEVVVGVIDTGIDYNHEDLRDNLWYNAGESGDKANNKQDDDGNGYVDDFRGWNFIYKDNTPYDDHGHGTHVAGTIGAVGNNGRGITGVCWRVRLMALKFLDGNGEGTTADAVKAIIYAVDNGAKILNNSWGGDEASQALRDAINYAHQRGVLFIAAAGNNSQNADQTPHYPSNYEVPNVISVASSARNDKLSYFSNFGRRTVDLAAPGSDILSAQPIGRYQVLSGTSMATPHVAGVCALVWSRFPLLESHQVMIRVLGAVEQKPDFVYRMTTGGRLNAARALATAPLIAQTTDWSYTPDTTGYQVNTAVVDDDTIMAAHLVYSLSTGVTDSVVMARGNDDTFAAKIPGQPVNTVIKYAIAATDNEGNRTISPEFTFKITTEPDPRDQTGCCGKRAVTVQGLEPAAQYAVEIPLNLVFFLLPIVLLRRRKKQSRANL